jgi:hypothetical protein
MLDYIQEHGLYMFKSGYSLAQTAPDRLLDRWHIEKREDLLEVSEFATGAVGINIDNPYGNSFFIDWQDAADAGMFAGHRAHHDSDSKHLLFLHARQDQSAASMILHDLGVKTAGEDQDFVAYYQTPYNALKCIFFISGI